MEILLRSSAETAPESLRLLNAIAGVWPVDEGNIVIDGRDVTKLPEYKRAAFLGRVFQDPMNGTVATMGIEENLALALRRGGRRTLKPGITGSERKLYRDLLLTAGTGAGGTPYL